jgi:hypothetical protein
VKAIEEYRKRHNLMNHSEAIRHALQEKFREEKLL